GRHVHAEASSIASFRMFPGRSGWPRAFPLEGWSCGKASKLRLREAPEGDQASEEAGGEGGEEAATQGFRRSRQRAGDRLERGGPGRNSGSGRWEPIARQGVIAA